MLIRKTTQYNKIIKNKKLNYPQKNVVLAHGFNLLNNPWFYCTWFKRALHMVLKPCARPPKQPWFYCTWFKRALQMVLRPCARPPKQPWFYCTWFRRSLEMVLRPCTRPPKQPMVFGGPCTWF